MSPKAEALVAYLLPVAPILVPVSVHFVLVCFVLLISTSLGWLPLTFLFSHLFLIGVGFWACHARKDIIPAIVFVMVILVSILMDIIQLGLYFSVNQDDNGGGNNSSERTWQFSAAMCIINLLFKPVSIALACVAIYVRAGGNIGRFGAGGDYSDLHGSNDQGPAAE